MKRISIRKKVRDVVDKFYDYDVMYADYLNGNVQLKFSNSRPKNGADKIITFNKLLSAFKVYGINVDRMRIAHGLWGGVTVHYRNDVHYVYTKNGPKLQKMLDN